MTDKTRMFITSGFYLGLSPVAPGTCGALVGLIFTIFLSLFNTIIDVKLLAFFNGLALGMVYLVSKELLPWAVKVWEEDDPKHFVLDEIGGYLVAYFIVGFKIVELGTTLPIKSLVYTFLLFRFFDICKIFPANIIDKHCHSHFGVFFDDVVSGIYAGIAMLVLWDTLI